MISSKIKIIIFDFDGVIIDSNQVKYDAWFEIFPAADRPAQKIVKAVLSDIREKSRYDILNEIFIRLEKKPEEIPDLVSEYAERYNQKVKKNLTKDKIFPGAIETISELGNKYRLYIVSNTPESSLRATLDRLGISQYFQGVYGIPTAKEMNLKNIINLEKVKSSEILVVGDGESDYESARNCHCYFIGLTNEFNGWIDEEFPLIRNLYALNIKEKEMNNAS